jgi:hypothetical protein
MFGALLGGLQERSHERDEQSLDDAGVLSSEGCAHHAGMQPIGGVTALAGCLLASS